MIRLALNGSFPAAEWYQAAAQGLPQADFVAVVDADPQLARQAAEMLGATTTASSLDQLLTDHSDTLDAVLIHSTLDSRSEAVEQAARRGKHVLVEGPIAISTQVCDQANQACKVADVRLMVGHPRRFLPAHSAVSQALTSGKLGQPGLLRIHQWLPRKSESKEYENKSREPTTKWIDWLSGEMDLANWLFQALPTDVFALAQRTSSDGNEVPPSSPFGNPNYIQVHLAYPRDGMALIDYSADLPPGSDYCSLSMIGETGAAYADDHHNMHLLYQGGAPTARHASQGNKPWMTQLQEFISSIEQSREPSITGNDGRAAIQVAEAVMESIASGDSVRLPGRDR